MASSSSSLSADASSVTSFTIKNRLQQARKTIRDVTNQTLKSVKSHCAVTNDSVVGVESLSMTREEELDLADALFGDDVTSGTSIGSESRSRKISEEIQNKLSSIEAQLSLYDRARGSREYADQNHDTDTGYRNDNSTSTMDVDFSTLLENDNYLTNANNDTEAISNTNDRDSKLTDALQEEAQDLKGKIQFLQRCTEARMALDDVDSYTMMGNLNIFPNQSYNLANTNTNTTDSSFSSHDSSSVSDSRNQYQHQFATGSTTSSSSKPALLLPIATAISKAQKALHEAEQCLNQSMPMQLHNQNSSTSHDVQVARQIIESMRVQIIRHIVDLESKVSSIIDSSIQISKKCITICNGVISNKDATSKHKPLSSCNDYEGLSVAFQVLSLLSEQPYLNNDKLSKALQSIANEITIQIIKPVLRDVRSALTKGVQPTFFKFTQRTNMSPNRGGTDDSIFKSHSSSLFVDKKYKRHLVTLEWNEVNESSASTNNRNNDTNFTLNWWSDLLDFIQTFALFLNEAMLLDQHQNLSQIFGSYFFLEDDMVIPSKVNGDRKSSQQFSLYSHGSKYDGAPVMKILIDLFEDECIPKLLSPTVLSTLPNIASFVQETTSKFEKALSDSLLLQETYEYKTIMEMETMNQINRRKQLSQSASKIMLIFAQKQGARILSQGRDILLHRDFHDTVQVGVNVREKQKAMQPSYFKHMLDFPDDNDDMSLFVLHEQKISLVSSDLMKLAIDTMDLAVQTDFSVDNELEKLMPLTLYRAVRELFDLYRAIIPSSYMHEVSTIPRTAAVLHNDCVYFAQKLLSLGLEYKDRLVLKRDAWKEGDSLMTCTFLDMVPCFRALAEKTMANMIRYQMNQLADLVCPRITYMKDMLRENEGVVEWTEAETALKAGLHHLRHLSKAWWNVLSYEIYSRSMGTLVDTLFSFYLEEVMKAKDISEPASQFLNALFTYAINGAAEIFAINEGFDESVQEATKHCKMWKKFHAIGEFMNMSIADINVKLSEGTFRGVSSSELSRLVCAVYEDTERRRKLLKLLTNHGN
jgi:hypothetical protein